MLLSQTAQYALRAASRLAALPAGASARARDLSEETRVPEPYLAKILRMLVEAKLLVSEKGHHGGFRLRLQASAISVADVLSAVHEGLEEKDCVFGYERCAPKNPCPLHPVYAELNSAVREWANRTTLADANVDLPADRGP